MEDLHRHFGSRKVWEDYNTPQCPFVNVTEIWSHDDSTTTTVESRGVLSMDLNNWLNEPSDKYITGEPHTRLLRMAWVGLDPEKNRSSPSNRDLDQLLTTWGLKDGYSYALSSYAGIDALPSETNARIFTATYHPKLAAAWSYAIIDGVPTTNAIIFAEGEERAEFLRALKSKWSVPLVGHAMFPAFLCSLMLSQELDTTFEDIKMVVRNVEARTGHHRFTTRRQTKPAAGELGTLSAQMSGCAAKLANAQRKLKVVEAMLTFILQHAQVQEPQVLPRTRTTDFGCEKSFFSTKVTPIPPTISDGPTPSALLMQTVGTMRHRAEMQAVDHTYVQQRVQVQIAALFHLIAQQDNAIAFETASATRSIAKDSLQDSSSMKMLALVAMFFLPGSFVAALFSAPLFDWDSADKNAADNPKSIALGTKPQFALFWAVAIPLTVATFVLYAAWILMQKKRLRRRLNAGTV
ncbi:hypothetical protein QBC39DRAFT_101446 [Podospora conica]|nr:hypothetical protein QBC39DRAFT_101446 [Schizothecium conicum]